MRRLLVAAIALGASVLVGTGGANACTIDQCWWSKPVCDRLSQCQVCYYAGGDSYCLNGAPR
jgi:hypothetical protein